MLLRLFFYTTARILFFSLYSLLVCFCTLLFSVLCPCFCFVLSRNTRRIREFQSNLISYITHTIILFKYTENWQCSRVHLRLIFNFFYHWNEKKKVLSETEGWLIVALFGEMNEKHTAELVLRKLFSSVYEYILTL